MKQPKWEMVYLLCNPKDPDYDRAVEWAKKYFRKPLRPQTSFGLTVIREIERIRNLRGGWSEALFTLRRFIKREALVRVVNRTQVKYRKISKRSRHKMTNKEIENRIVDAFAEAFKRSWLKRTS